MGLRVEATGIVVYPENVKTITEMKPQKTETELKSSLEMVNCLCRFNRKLAELQRPLSRLNKKKMNGYWGKCSRECSTRLKGEIARALVLAKYDPHAKHSVICGF